MSIENVEEKQLLPHHEQLPLCTSRLPYRQGRKLTAVKVYTINNESNHLLIFGVPSLNLRQETKALFMQFGKLLQFNLSQDHPAEAFTETYHAKYERIQSARIAKRMLDTKNYYGGSLHVCYAPELETVEETRNKLFKRRKDVLFRLNNLHREAMEAKEIINQKNDYNSQVTETVINSTEDIVPIVNELGDLEDISCDTKKINMGNQNIIYLNKNKRKSTKKDIIEKKFKTYLESSNSEEIVDCFTPDKEIISNINEALNYNKFGNEIVKKVETKPMNRIVFKNKKT